MAGLGAGIRSIQLISLQHVTRNKMITSDIQDAGGEPAAVLFEIQEALCERLGIPLDTRFSIHDLRRHRHSRSMILQSDALRDRIFVKFGAHFSGGHEWDVKSEYEGYCAAEAMEVDKTRFFSIRPLLYREEPHILATVFAENTRPLKKVIDQGLRRLFPAISAAEVIRLTQRTAEWLSGFMDLKERYVDQATPADLIGFCADRWKEILAWGRLSDNRDVDKDRLIRYLDTLFKGYDREDRVWLTRNHDDFGPHNVVIDKMGRIGVIDIGFGPPDGHAMAYEDAATFLIYLEQMRNNPLYRPRILEVIIHSFIDRLLPFQKQIHTFMPAYVKKTLAHLAWHYHPNRKPGSRWERYSFGKWSRLRTNWLRHETAIGRPVPHRGVYTWLYPTRGNV
jgi:hypothetical protein